MNTIHRTGIAAALLLSGCSLVINSGDYTGGDGSSPMACACATGPLCLAGGRCAWSNSCDTSIPVPSCPSDGGEVWAFRILTRPSGSVMPADLHITAVPAGPGTTSAAPESWAFLWRDAMTLQVAYASATSTAEGGCHSGHPLGPVQSCGSADLVAGHVDARTLYLGSGTAPPNTAMVTANGGMARLWKLRAQTGSDGTLGSLCGDASTDADYGSVRISGVSLASMGPDPSGFVQVGTRSGGFVDSAAGTTGTSHFLLDLAGPVAAGAKLAAYRATSGATAEVWGGDASSLGHAVSPALSADPVASVDPTGASPQDMFVLPRNDASFSFIECTPVGLGAPTCMERLVMRGPYQVGAPIAAAAHSGTQWLYSMENTPDGKRELTRRAGMMDVMPLLNDATVGGHLVDLLAIDAEGLVMPSSFDYVWAAFVTVDRSGVSSVELWVGANRICR